MGSRGGTASYIKAGSYGPSAQPPFLVGFPTPAAAARDFGAFILPFGAGAVFRQFLAAGIFGAPGDLDLLSLVAVPDFLRLGRANAERRAGGASGAGGGGAADSDLQEVLGEQATIFRGDGDDSLFGMGKLPLLALALVLLSSLLLVAAVLPPGVVAFTPLHPGRFAHLRQPLAWTAIAILVPVAIVTLVYALT